MPSVSVAGDMFFDVNKNSFTENEDFLVNIYIDTKDSSVNAIEGGVLFPSDILELKEIRDGNSIINFWVEKPTKISDGRINFSGITTGGFSGSKVFLFGAVFQAKKNGEGVFDFVDIKTLKNDGLGTEIPIKNKPYIFSVSDKLDNTTKEDLIINDTNPPEDFVPFVANDSSIFEGKNFIVFSTVDKGSGIDHYEVKESSWGLGGKYIQAESPYLLKDQRLKSKIYVKAVDKLGNVKIVKVNGQNKRSLLEQSLIVGIILFVCIFVLFRKKIWSKLFLK